MDRFVDLTVSAVLLAGLYATMAYGLGLIYGVLRVVNLAHGGVIMAGAYLGWMHQRNGFQIGEGVALHYWINVLAGIAAIRNGGSAPLLSLRVPF